MNSSIPISLPEFLQQRSRDLDAQTKALERVKEQEAARPLAARLLDAFLDAHNHEVCIEWNPRNSVAHRAVWWDVGGEKWCALRGADVSENRNRRFFDGCDLDAAFRWLLS